MQILQHIGAKTSVMEEKISMKDAKKILADIAKGHPKGEWKNGKWQGAGLRKDGKVLEINYLNHPFIQYEILEDNK